jgi:hypothetical protein
MEGSTLLIFFASLIMLLMVIIYCFIEFHLLELEPSKSVSYQLVRKKISSNFIDICTIILFYILVQTTSKNIQISSGLVIFISRMLISVYSPFYH